MWARTYQDLSKLEYTSIYIRRDLRIFISIESTSITRWFTINSLPWCGMFSWCTICNRSIWKIFFLSRVNQLQFHFLVLFLDFNKGILQTRNLFLKLFYNRLSLSKVNYLVSLMLGFLLVCDQSGFQIKNLVLIELC